MLITVVAVGDAQALDQKRTQFVTSLAVERQFSESNLGWRANIFSFQAPGVANIYFFYGGLTYQKNLGDWSIWTSPQVVGVANFFADRDAVGPALWVVLNNQWFKLFLDPELYFGSSGRKGYYGYYSADLKPSAWLSLGMQLEQVHNSKLSNQFGPHLAVSKDNVTCSISWFADLDNKSQQYRLMFGVTF